ncbi:MAG: hypothetical protein IID45_00925, partial [Planctomycetes bacterium]|nr:hypothetical protein [Planctomycetota bacterium]
YQAQLALAINDEAGATKPDSEKMQFQLTAILAGQQTIEELLSKVPATHPSRKKLDAIRKLLQISAKVAAFNEQQKKRTRKQSIAEVLGDGTKLALELGAMFNPLVVGTGVAAGSLYTRARTVYIIQPALKSLRIALASTYNAEIHLKAKRDQTRRFLAEQREMIRRYESLRR